MMKIQKVFKIFIILYEYYTINIIKLLKKYLCKFEIICEFKIYSIYQ